MSGNSVEGQQVLGAATAGGAAATLVGNSENNLFRSILIGVIAIALIVIAMRLVKVYLDKKE